MRERVVGEGDEVVSSPQANAGAAKDEKGEEDERRKMAAADAMRPVRNAVSRIGEG